MAKVKVRNVSVLKNECDIFSRFIFEIVFEALEDIQEDIEWKLIYVGSAENERFDQTLDNVLVGPIPRGVHKFLFDAPGPNWKLIPKSDIVGLTVILITCHYREQEFARVGYYVNNEYTSDELRESPPEEPKLKELKRIIIASDPRITTFHIKWDLDDPVINQ
ncbi:hypothetical protein HZS_2910 [Henneguya salminicola]|nr:hypothetical protein HZS_2910 [Henneguya salminicola]